MNTSRYGQVTFDEEAHAAHPEGCKCCSTDGGGDCGFCRVYYQGPIEAEVE